MGDGLGDVHVDAVALQRGADEREARAELLRRVTEDGYVDDYCGVRISSSGKRFEVRDAYVWNVYHGEERVGQAALFRREGCKFL